MKDYRIEVRLKNNRILKRIEELGFPSIAAFCKACKIPYQETVNLISMKKPALLVSGGWRKGAETLALYLNCEPEDLFNERQAAGAIKSKAVMELDEPTLSLDDAAKLSLPAPDFEDEEMRADILSKTVGLLAPRQQTALDMYAHGMTLKQIGDELEVGPERARQIIRKAIQVLRHPSRYNLLRHLNADKPLTRSRWDVDLYQGSRTND